MERVPFRPDFVLGIASVAEAKREALGCYASQFTRGASAAPTLINAPEFLEWLAARDRHYGSLAGCGLGEPFRARDPLFLGGLAAVLPPEPGARP